MSCAVNAFLDYIFAIFFMIGLTLLILTYNFGTASWSCHAVQQTDIKL